MVDAKIIREKVASDIRWLERAILAIYRFQTAQEQNAENTLFSNGVGFSGADARRGTYYAKWILSGRRLTGEHLDKARKMMPKYAGQLEKIAKNSRNCP